MEQFKNIRRVDLETGEPAAFSVRQLYYADKNANRIGAMVYANGDPVALTGTCSGTAIRADGTTVPMTGAISGNTAYVDLIQDCYAIEGEIRIFVKITSGNVTATLAAAVGTVRLTETNAVIDPGTVIPSVSALISAIDDAIASIPADYSDLLAAIAPDYTGLTFPVKKGTWCWYSGSLRRAAVDIPSTESWTAAHWETAPLSNALAGDVAELKSAMGDNGMAQPIVDGWITGHRWYIPAVGSDETGRQADISTWRYIKIPCTAGDKFVITASATSGYKPWGFFDSSDHCLKRDENSTSVSKQLIEAPTETAYLAINQDANRGQCYIGEFLGSSVDRRIDSLEETIAPQLNQIITFYDISALESFDAKTGLPLNRYTYGTYTQLESTFTGTDAPDFGFMGSNKIRVEKRPVSGLSNNVYILLIDNITTRQHFEMQALVNATPPFRWVLPDTTLTKSNVAADAKATAQAIDAAKVDCMAQSVAYDYPNNLYDKTTGGTSGYWNGTGYHTTSGALRITHPIPVKNGVTYIMPFDAGGLGSNNWIAKVDPTEDDPTEAFISAISGVIADGKLTFTADFNGYVSANMGRLTDDNYYFSALYSREINPLFGKKLSVNGDSICAGAGYAGGYAKMIGLRNNMLVQNIAVNGATITTGTKFANTGEDRHWISTSIGDMAADADYIILEGGINDDTTVIGVNKLGALTEATTFSGEFDNTTFCGALEYMFSQVYARFPGKKIGFIIVHKAAVLLNSNGVSGSNRYPLIVNACKKWGIPYLDLNTECPPLNYIDSLKTAYTNNGDGWHPNELGYATYYVPKIEAWMKTL